MPALAIVGIERVYHFSPLHYLIFIARAQALLGKRQLAREGFPSEHFRSRSRRIDVDRGFEDWVHLTTDVAPRILGAKLARGFPHIGISIPASDVDGADFLLCRYNIAMTRKLRRGLSAGYSEGPETGRYIGEFQVPVAATDDDKIALVRRHYPSTMIEVLVRGRLTLAASSIVLAYDADDASICRRVLEGVGLNWEVRLVDPPKLYVRHNAYRTEVLKFLEIATESPGWRGNGLEFDQL
jgi:hypothetical protein